MKIRTYIEFTLIFAIAVLSGWFFTDAVRWVFNKTETGLPDQGADPHIVAFKMDDGGNTAYTALKYRDSRMEVVRWKKDATNSPAKVGETRYAVTTTTPRIVNSGLEVGEIRYADGTTKKPSKKKYPGMPDFKKNYRITTDGSWFRVEHVSRNSAVNPLRFDGYEEKETWSPIMSIATSNHRQGLRTIEEAREYVEKFSGYDEDKWKAEYDNKHGWRVVE